MNAELHTPAIETLIAGSRVLAEWESHYASARRAVIDDEVFAELRSLADGDPEFLRDLIETYVEQAEILLAGARTEASAGNAPQLVRLVHTLGGSSRNVGALDFARLCSAVEQDAQSRDVRPAALPAMVDLLAEPLEETCVALRERLRLLSLEG